jgi:hypothetical protein
MEIRNRQVRFKVRDIHIPDPQDILMELHGDDLLQGKAVDLSDNGTQDATFVVIEVAGLSQPVIIALARLLDVE